MMRAAFSRARMQTIWRPAARATLRGLGAGEHDASLLARLQAGTVPDWLELLPLAGPFAVYRVKP